MLRPMLGLCCLAITMTVPARADACAPWSDRLVIDETDLPACVEAAAYSGDDGAIEVTNHCAEMLRIEGPAAGCPDCDEPLELEADQTGVFTVTYATTSTDAASTPFTLVWSTQGASGTIEVTVSHARGGCGSADEEETTGCGVASGSARDGWMFPLALLVGLMAARRRRLR